MTRAWTAGWALPSKRRGRESAVQSLLPGSFDLAACQLPAYSTTLLSLAWLDSSVSESELPGLALEARKSLT